MTMGYYAARKGTRHGDYMGGLYSEILWKRLGHTAPSVVDGVICFTRDDGTWTGRIVALDLFKDEPWRVLVRDLEDVVLEQASEDPEKK